MRFWAFGDLGYVDLGRLSVRVWSSGLWNLANTIEGAACFIQLLIFNPTIILHWQGACGFGMWRVCG